MSKSLDYCRAVAKKAGYSWNGYESEQEAENVFWICQQQIDKYPTSVKDEKGNPVSFDVDLELEFDPEADFQNVISAYNIHDGTLCFSIRLFEQCAFSVMSLRIQRILKNPPKNGERVKITVGNFVVMDEYDQKFAPEGKPWMTNRTTVLLPLKIEVLRNKNPDGAGRQAK